MDAQALLRPVTFYEAQARHRRAASLWALACAGAAAVIAAAASLAITPVVIVVTIAAARLVDLQIPLPDDVWSAVRGALTTPALMLAPGFVIVLAAWRRIRARAWREDGARLLHELDARPPSAPVLEERQLANVVEETAIAAGLASPRVYVTPHGDAVAATAGVTPRDAAIVFTDQALAALDRDQTQALAANAMAAFVNGDHRLHVEASAVARIHDNLMHVCAWPLRAHGAALFLLSPVAAVLLAVKFFLILTTLCLVAPLVGSILRHRRYLADATAVELTRNPDALARALVAIDPLPRLARGGHWAPQHFVATPVFRNVETPLPLIAAQPPVQARINRLRALGATVAVPPKPPGRPRALRAEDLVSGAIVLAIVSPFLLYLVTVAVLAISGAVFAAYWLASWAAARLIP